MDKKAILALTIDGKLTYCTAPENRRGIGRCNHIFHKNINETDEEFLERTSNLNFISINELETTNNINAKVSVGGAQNKWWSKYYKTLYKQDTNDSTRGLIQWNGLSEDFISKFANNMTNLKCAKYDTVYINGNVGCESKNFLEKDEKLIEFSSILDDKDMEYLTDIDNENFDEKFEYLCDKIQEKTNNKYNPTNDLIKLIKFDIITMNADRHYGNIGLVYNQKEDKFDFSTIYDNGQCLLSENIYKNTEAYGYDKFNLPGLSMFRMFPMKNYIKFALNHSNEENNITIDLDKTEEFIDNYNNKYYDNEKVEKVKWLLWDNLDIYDEIGLINN